MENLIQDIDSIISDCNNQINDKILGLTYLEQIKYHLLAKLRPLKSSLYDNLKKEEIKSQFANNSLLIKLERYTESISRIKNNLLNDSLFIVIEGSKSIEIYKSVDTKKFISLNLYKNNGITLPKGTIITESISKGTVLMDIVYNEHVVDIEK